jgi:hypothetical protein
VNDTIGLLLGPLHQVIGPASASRANFSRDRSKEATDLLSSFARRSFISFCGSRQVRAVSFACSMDCCISFSTSIISLQNIAFHTYILSKLSRL